MSKPPFFSIVIPMYNRRAEIGRALNSCLAQTSADFEVVIVDDRSTDDSVGVVRAYNDSRIRVIVHEANRGACAARNTAANASAGAWLVFLDSDDELLPHALETMRRRIEEKDSVADKLLLMCRYTDGTLSPDPPFPNRVWGYEEYAAWLGSMIGRRTEAIPVTRRLAFLECPYENGHAPEGLHELNFIRRYRTYACSDVVRIYHQDASVRVVRPTTEWLRLNGAAFARALDLMIELHGDVLARHAAPLLQSHRIAAAYYHFFGGRRRRGMLRALEALRVRPLAFDAWAIMVLGLLGPWALALALQLRR